jgi:urea transport system permease protein
MLRILLMCLVSIWLPVAVAAQDLQFILQTHQTTVAEPSRRTVSTVLEPLVASGLAEVPEFLTRWQGREVWVSDATGLFYYKIDGQTLDIVSKEVVGDTVEPLTNIKPNGGVRGVISEALVEFQLSDPVLARRQDALDSIARNLDASYMEPLQASIEGETDAALKARKIQLVSFLQARFSKDQTTRLTALNALSESLSVETRAILNQVLTTTSGVATALPEGANIARTLTPDSDDLPRVAAYDILVAAKLAPARLTQADILGHLEQNVQNGQVAGFAVGTLNTLEAREKAYTALVSAGLAPARLTEPEVDQILSTHVFFEAYTEKDPVITTATRAVLDHVENRVAVGQAADLALDGLSLASIYFLAAIGLAITFGVMGVINMAHGEFIMMGAYTGYVVQQFVPNYTASLIVALPLAFAVTFAAGVAMERLVIRHLYHRPLETLLATFGISIALQQLAKNIFGTQARPLTSPSWLDGAWVFNEVVQISYIRIAIFVLALGFLALLLFILKRTRLGLEVRAVTQNPRMAASMGINPDRINMLTFGLGSGIAGIAGVAIGLYAKVTSEMGVDYIVQSFMTVVVGGVGNVWGTLAGAAMIGFLQKGIEWLNPSNTLAAQTYMILFIILFIQFRPKGIVALKGRAAGD